MPGHSLWLVPAPDSSLYKNIHTLILSTIPSLYSESATHAFVPHITLTSDVTLSPSAREDPQTWLDGLNLDFHSTEENRFPLTVDARSLEVSEAFFRKLTMPAAKYAEIKELAARCRSAGVSGVDLEAAREWAEGTYMPHISLMYSEIPTAAVEAELGQVRKVVREALQGSGSSHGDENENPNGELWLVDTTKPLPQWAPVARRKVERWMQWHVTVAGTD